MRLLESSIFIGIAFVLHLGVAGWSMSDGEQAAGSGGAASISLTGSVGSMAAMVEEWTKPPEIEEMINPPATPVLDLSQSQVEQVQKTIPPNTVAQPIAPTATSSLVVPLSVLDALPLPAVPISTDAPEALSELETTIEKSPQLSEPADRMPPLSMDSSAMLLDPSRSDQLPKIAPEPEPQTERVEKSSPPPQRPQPPKPTPPERPPAQAAAAQPSTTARGSGGGRSAGQSGKAVESTSSQGNQASLIATWSGQIQRQLQRKLVYPRKARARGMTGRTVVAIKVNSTGAILSVSVQQSSGETMLDRAALETFSRVGRLPNAPEGLAAGSYNFRIPVVFSGR